MPVREVQLTFTTVSDESQKAEKLNRVFAMNNDLWSNIYCRELPVRFLFGGSAIEGEQTFRIVSIDNNDDI